MWRGRISPKRELADALGVTIGSVVMMFPPLAKVRYDKLRSIFSNRRLLELSLAFSWLIGSLVMFALALAFFRDTPSYMNGVIMIGTARCIAMVIIWNDLVGGDNDYAAGLVALNVIFQVMFYVSMAWLFMTVLPSLFGLESTVADVGLWQVAQSVLIYLGIPFLVGMAVSILLRPRKGDE